MQLIKKISLIALATIISAFTELEATTLIVPTQYATIQVALSAAFNGDTIGVLPGTYSGSGNIAVVIDKLVTIRGLKDNVNTGNIVFDPQVQNGPHIFRIVNPSPFVAGQVTIENIEFNKTSSVTMRAISVVSDVDVLIQNNIFRNLSVITGGAISIVGTAAPIVAKTKIYNNYFENNGNPNFGGGQYGGGAILALLNAGVELEIAGNTFLNNHSDKGGAIHVNGLQTPNGGNPVLIARNTFNRNTPSTFQQGGGDAIFVSGNMDAVIENNVITDHYFYNSLIQIDNPRTGTFKVQHNLIYNNPSNQSSNNNYSLGVGVYVGLSPIIEVANNIIYPLLSSNSNTVSIADQSQGSLGATTIIYNNNMSLNNVNTTHFPNISANYNGVPLFADMATLDYHPVIGSPDEDMASILAPQLLIDIDSSRRDGGNLNDVGPYEYRSDGGTIYPLGLLPDKEILKGTTLILRTVAEPNTAIFCIVGLKKLTVPSNTPFGLLDIDPALPWTSLSLGVTNANGVLDFTFPIPTSAFNIDLFYQVATFKSSGLWLGNTTEVRVRQ